MGSRELISDDGVLLLEIALEKLRALGSHWRETADAIETTVAAKGGGHLVLSISASARCFRVDEGRSVTLARRKAPWRILSHLAQCRSSRPGEGIPLDDLVTVGWPKEQIQPRAAAARVYFVVRELRMAGLRQVLMTSGDGYLIDPRYTVVWV